MREIIFNHSYILKHDKMRTYIIATDSNNTSNVIKGWVSKIHPIYAMILSFLSKPCTEEEAVEQLSFFLSVSLREAQKVLNLFIKSEEPFITEYQGFPCPFPTKLIIPVNEENSIRRSYSPHDFIYSNIDIEQERCYTSPLGLVFMVNNICATNCIYCYADKTTQSDMMSLEEIEKICIEAQKLGISSITISGGEFFMYKQWYELLHLLIRYGYKPNLISTKVPLTEADILKIKELDIKLQISLDSSNASTLSTLLKVNQNYSEKIKQTILLLEELQVKFQVATIITNQNASISEIENLYTFLSPLKNLVRWEIRAAFRSLYSSSDFNLIKASEGQIVEIASWIKEKQLESPITLLWSPNNTKFYFTAKNGSKSFSGSRCSANFSHMVVLPDGKVTICEQLYWNPRFIIGDIKKQSIEEIWNSPRALFLANIPQSAIQETSSCKSCFLYDSCVQYPNKCYSDVLKAYGDQNWDFPDPRCNQAPKLINDMN